MHATFFIYGFRSQQNDRYGKSPITRRPDNGRLSGRNNRSVRAMAWFRPASLSTVPEWRRALRSTEDPSWKYLRTCKPGSVLHLAMKAPSFIQDAPRGTPRSIYPPAGRAALLPAYLIFQPVGFTEMASSLTPSAGSYPAFSPLPRQAGAVSLSVALSVARPSPALPLPVRKHGALCCPDFPPPSLRRAAMERCAGCQ